MKKQLVSVSVCEDESVCVCTTRLQYPAEVQLPLSPDDPRKDRAEYIVWVSGGAPVLPRPEVTRHDIKLLLSLILLVTRLQMLVGLARRCTPVM